MDEDTCPSVRNSSIQRPFHFKTLGTVLNTHTFLPERNLKEMSERKGNSSHTENTYLETKTRDEDPSRPSKGPKRISSPFPFY